MMTLEQFSLFRATKRILHRLAGFKWLQARAQAQDEEMPHERRDQSELPVYDSETAPHGISKEVQALTNFLDRHPDTRACFKALALLERTVCTASTLRANDTLSFATPVLLQKAKRQLDALCGSMPTDQHLEAFRQQIAHKLSEHQAIADRDSEFAVTAHPSDLLDDGSWFKSNCIVVDFQDTKPMAGKVSQHQTNAADGSDADPSELLDDDAWFKYRHSVVGSQDTRRQAAWRARAAA